MKVEIIQKYLIVVWINVVNGSAVASGQAANVLRASLRHCCQLLLELLVLTATPAETNFLCDRDQSDHVVFIFIRWEHNYCHNSTMITGPLQQMRYIYICKLLYFGICMHHLKSIMGNLMIKLILNMKYRPLNYIIRLFAWWHMHLGD